MIINTGGINSPYGRNHFLRLGDVQDTLNVGKDTLSRRVESELHRLHLGNGNRLFPVGYINGLVDFISTSPAAAKHKPITAYAQEYALTDPAQEQILQAEAEFGALMESSSATVGSGEKVISARAAGLLLGFSHATIVNDWSKRPGWLPEADVMVGEVPYADTYLTLNGLQQFCAWHRPTVLNPEVL